MIRAVIFDLDGTLLHMKLRIKEAKTELVRRLRNMGINSDQITAKIPTEEIVSRIIENYGLSRSYLMKLVDEVYIPYELEAAKAAELKEGVKDVLMKLRAMGFKLAIASNNGRLGVNLALKNTSIKHFFDVIVTRNDVNRMKPSGALIIEAIRRLGVKPSEAVYVGDTAYDVLAAHEVGILSIVISGGADPISRVLKYRPEIIIRDIKELPEVLKERNL
ncbi:MAG: hypothetical protein DRN68_06185 [Thaumarchaeota archaeon]|nr:MAG: hypothetical protein DRN68_06185 [Nitrososphaerota archaeon]